MYNSTYRISGTFDGDFIWWFGGFVLNRQTKVTANTIFRWYCGSILWQSLANPPN